MKHNESSPKYRTKRSNQLSILNRLIEQLKSEKAMLIRVESLLKDKLVEQSERNNMNKY